MKTQKNNKRDRWERPRIVSQSWPLAKSGGAAGHHKPAKNLRGGKKDE